MANRLMGAQTPLERVVQKIINGQAADYSNGAAGVLAGLATGGCASGMIGELIYYKDTIPFYRRHRREIAKLLAETIDGLGAEGPVGVFGEKWDKEDPLGQESLNQNLLAWFAFEETARRLAEVTGKSGKRKER